MYVKTSSNRLYIICIYIFIYVHMKNIYLYTQKFVEADETSCNRLYSSSGLHVKAVTDPKF